MHAMEIQEHARRLLEAHGPKAIAEAAKRAKDSEQQGDEGSARDWRRIEAALIAMRGPRST